MPPSEPLEDGALRGRNRSAPADLPETGDQMCMDSDSNTSPVIFCNTVRASQSSQDSWMRPFSSRWKLMPRATRIKELIAIGTSGNQKPDRLTAAREILDWNGYDLSRLQRF